MDNIIQYYSELGLDFLSQVQLGAVILFALLITVCITRFILGKRANVHCAVSSAITILFMFLAVKLLVYMDIPYIYNKNALPFATLSDNNLQLFVFRGAHYTAVSAQLLRMVILAFLVNTIDSWMPKTNNFFLWLLIRVICVFITLLIYLTAYTLLSKYLPEVIAVYAPAILVVLMIVLFATGSLKLLVGIALTTVNPIIAALYTFFFANIVGKMVSRAMLTTTLITAISLILQSLDITHISISNNALITYLPFLAVLLLLWYVIRQGKKSTK